jgi:hypothetical protein
LVRSRDRLADHDSDAESRDRSERGEQHAFCEDLLQHTTARAANGEPNGKFLSPRRRACEQQIGEIDGRNQQHQPRNRHQDPERLRIPLPER